MIKKISLILLFTVSAYGIYVAPAKQTVVVVGGLGTQANKASTNGGGATKAVWDAGSPSDFINTNGGPITSDADAAFDYGDKTVTAVGIGTGVTVGTLCYLDDGAAEASFFTGVYEVTTVAANVLTFANIELSGIDTDQANGVTCNVGGALATLQGALDNSVNDGTTEDRFIYDNIATETITAIIDVDTNGGDTVDSIFIIGYNATLAAESSVIITTTSDIDALLKFDGSQMYYTFKNISFNGGGKDASRALYCVDDVGDASDYVTFVNCKFYGAESHGVKVESDYWNFVKCEFYLNGGDGLYCAANDGLYDQHINCSFHDNDTHGLNINARDSLVLGCLSYDNGKDAASGDGFRFESSSNLGRIIGNTAYGNFGDGFHRDDSAYYAIMFNNTSVGNGDYGYDLQTDAYRCLIFFGYNHAYDNDQNAGIAAGGDYCSECASEAAFQAFFDGNNKTGDPKFTSVADGAENFTPTSGSDLIDNALDAGTN